MRRKDDILQPNLKLIFLITVTLLLVSSFPRSLDGSRSEEIEFSSDPIPTRNNDIKIDGDANLLTISFEQGWPGNGTAEYPILIKDREFNGSGPGHSLSILNTDLFINIVECEFSRGNGSEDIEYPDYDENDFFKYIYNRGGSLLIRWVGNITVSGSVFLGDRTDGIHLLNSENVLFSNNTYSNIHYGAMLGTSTDFSAVDELFENCERGCYFIGMRYASVVRQEFSNNSKGLTVENSRDININRSSFRGNGVGVYLDHFNEFVTTFDNTFEGNEIGILIGDENRGGYNKYMEHHQNSFVEENEFAVCIFGGGYQNVHNNTMKGCGIRLEYIYNDRLETNEISPSNLVNGLPVLFLKEEVGGNFSGEYGQVILYRCYHLNFSDMDLDSSSIGVQMILSQYCVLSNCTVRNMSGPGLYSIYSPWITLNNCTLSFNEVGVDIDSTITIDNCRISNNRKDGFYRSYSNNGRVQIKNSIITDNGRNGIFNCYHDVITVTNTNCSNNGFNGIYIVDPYRFVITECIFLENRVGIFIDCEYYQHGNGEIRDNNCSYNQYYGIYLAWVGGNIISGNDCIDNLLDGIYLAGSWNNEIFSNRVKGGERSVKINGYGNRVHKNEFIGFNETGVFFSWHGTNELFDNMFICENASAVYLSSSTPHTLKNNTMIGGGLRIFGKEASDFYHDIYPSNTVNGRPVLYLTQEYDLKISDEYGQIILIECWNSEIRDVSMNRSTIGLTLVQCWDLKIENITLSGMETGISFLRTSRSSIAESEFIGCYSSGLFINETSKENYIYHNNFIENKVHVVDDSNDTVYNDLSLLGNYWDDYREKVPGDVKPLTMVWDTPYPITENSTHRDKFPLIFPYGTTDLSDPQFIKDLTPGWIMFGDQIDFRVVVSDDLMVSRVLLKYWSEGEGFFSEDMALIGENMWAFSTVWDEPYDPVYYWFRAYDTFGDHTQTDDGCIEVMDLLPWFGPDETYGTGTTGDLFQFKIPVFDDLGVVEVSVKYWFEGADPIDLNLENLEVHLKYLKLPKDRCGEMFYRFRAIDSSSNSNITPIFSVNIDDNDPPVADAGPDIRSLEGIWIRLDGSGSFDNIGITSWRWICNVNGAGVFLFGADPEMFFREAGDYTIELIVEDGYGNSASDVILVRIDARPQPEMLNIRVGPVIDVAGNPLEGVLIELEVNGTVLTCVTDGSGWGEMTILASAIQGRVNVRMNKEGYREAFYITHLNSNADLADDPPSMELLPEDAEDESDDIGRAISVTLILFLFLSLSALIAVIGWVRRLKEGPEQAMLDE